jgi:hypothetical protein
MRAPEVSGRHADCVIAPSLVAAAQPAAEVSAAGHVSPRPAGAYVADMTTPTVTEMSIALEAVTRDDFLDSLPSARAPEAPPQRDLVLLSLVRCPRLAAERRAA